MTNKRSMDEWLFALAIYPSFNASDRYYLYLEMVDHYAKESDCDSLKKVIQHRRSIKKLSQKKKASFALFLQTCNVGEEMTRYKTSNVSWKYLYDADYPLALREIYVPPVVLFYQGDFSILAESTCLAVVGARAATKYGLQAVATILPELLNQSIEPITIVSGLARGIDTQAHKVTMQEKGRTVGVIGSGLDQMYPKENQVLQKRMAQEELVLSEYPLGAKPLKFRFPERNRIIAGLSRGIFVVEAKKRSGSLITAYNGLDENRDIFALPGSIYENNSEGCHRLIQLGALLTKTGTDILQEWSLI